MSNGFAAARDASRVKKGLGCTAAVAVDLLLGLAEHERPVQSLFDCCAT